MTTTQGTLEYIDPTTLVIETNVRTSAALTPDFVASIRLHGVQQPVIAHRDSTGTVTVRAGQRRTTAAREVGLTSIPVLIVTADDDSTAARIVDQLIENEHRAELTDSDRIGAWHQLEMEGLSVANIAKRLGTDKKRIASGLAVANSDTGTRLVQEVALTLDQAADLLEFADDTDLVDELSKTAAEDPGYFPVAVQRARDEREATALRTAATEVEEAKGHTILDPNGYDGPGHRLDYLRTAEGEPVDPESIQGKEGIAVRVQAYRGYNEDTASVRLTYYVANPADLGLTIRPGYENTGAANTGPMTDEQKAARKVLIANNKEWNAAESVRREWLASLIARKALPKDAARVIATGLTSQRYSVSQAMSRGNSLATALLGLKSDYESSAIATYLDKHPARAAFVSLAVVLGGIEDSTSTNSWRAPDARTAAYLNTLAGWGYTLSPVERIAAQLDAETTT